MGKEGPQLAVQPGSPQQHPGRGDGGRASGPEPEGLGPQGDTWNFTLLGISFGVVAGRGTPSRA